MRDTIFHTTTTHLSFWDRVKVMLGKPVIVRSEITCEVRYQAELLIVVKASASSDVPPVFPRKSKRGYGEVITIAEA